MNFATHFPDFSLMRTLRLIKALFDPVMVFSIVVIMESNMTINYELPVGNIIIVYIQVQENSISRTGI
ncbi:unnamed protein product [Microthlaspi erraticum]|uniref:Uncharacterized protein n=1 Tax=Microthlaspi erraticum TaxID=1685480 RepID=A0A6D2I2G1_9BRAS|nr:unnamed protein product [Microthlaspi erraticum]